MSRASKVLEIINYNSLKRFRDKTIGSTGDTLGVIVDTSGSMLNIQLKEVVRRVVKNFRNKLSGIDNVLISNLDGSSEEVPFSELSNGMDKVLIKMTGSDPSKAIDAMSSSAGTIQGLVIVSDFDWLVYPTFPSSIQDIPILLVNLNSQVGDVSRVQIANPGIKFNITKVK